VGFFADDRRVSLGSPRRVALGSPCVLIGPEGVENGKNAGASSSSSASSVRPILCAEKRGGRLNNRLSAGSESDSDELDSAASEDDPSFTFDKAAVFEGA